MPDAVLRVALRRAIGQVRYLQPVPPKAADPLTAATYQQLESDFGMLAPPVALHAAVPPLLAACWLMLRESLVADAPVSRATLEAVAAAVSAGNACPYCVTVHGATGQALASIGDGRPEPLTTEVVNWVDLAARRHTAGYPPGDAAAAARLVGVLATFHYLNRMVNVFLARSPLPGALPGMLRAPALQLLGRHAGATAGRHHPAGESLPLLPAATRRHRPAWAAADPILAEAFARATAAIEQTADVQVPRSVRQLLTELLSRWDGRPAGLDTRWLDEPLAGLPAGDRPAGRLALLTAFASYRVEDSQVATFRRSHPGDPALLGLTSWASMATARQIASWISADHGGSAQHRGNA
ncbi:MAG: carboxymuconolactone decarboxylase family protein [Jatrophihabitantaceae bacterium]